LIVQSEANTVTAEVWLIGKLASWLLNYVVGCIVSWPNTVLQCTTLDHLSQKTWSQHTGHTVRQTQTCTCYNKSGAMSCKATSMFFWYAIHEYMRRLQVAYYRNISSTMLPLPSWSTLRPSKLKNRKAYDVQTSDWSLDMLTTHRLAKCLLSLQLIFSTHYFMQIGRQAFPSVLWHCWFSNRKASGL